MVQMSPPKSAGVAGTNLEFSKKFNRRAVIETIRLHGSLPRADIARLTSLTPQAVGNIVAELQEGGFLYANDPLRGGRGQPATPMSINPDGAYSIGLQLDHRVLIAVMVDLAGKVRARAELPVDRPTPKQALPLILRLVRMLRKTSEVNWRRVLGIGLATPGPLGAEAARHFSPDHLPDWDDLSVVGEISGKLDLQVLVENDANAAAIAERLYGVARNLQSFVYLFVGIGLGSGLFLNGSLYRGSSRNAGEIGHMVVMPGGRPCMCSNHGCLERYLSLRAAYEALGVPDPDMVRPDILLDSSPAVATSVERWLDEAAEPLRRAINALESVLDAEAIVIGGFMPPALIERLVGRLAPLPVSVRALADQRGPRILIGTAGYDTAALGAAALPIFDEFNPQLDVLLKG